MTTKYEGAEIMDAVLKVQIIWSLNFYISNNNVMFRIVNLLRHSAHLWRQNSTVTQKKKTPFQKRGEARRTKGETKKLE